MTDLDQGDESVSFGAELPDAFKPVDAWVGSGINFLDDVQTFYRERSVIEKEYSQKLAALSKRYTERKVKKSTSLSVGDSPQMTPGSLESATLVTWTEILNRTDKVAKERDRLANEFSLQVADYTKGMASRLEDFRKLYQSFSDRLIEDRDGFYSDCKHAKQRYDAACQAMETARMKSQKDASKSKNARHYEKALVEMNNAKNIYLISINVANRIKDKYYHEDIPELLNDLQDMNESRVRRLNSVWVQAINLEDACFDRCKDHLSKERDMVGMNKPKLDSVMFSKHNQGPWNDPEDFIYIPSPIWHEDEEMVTDTQAVGYLRNKVAKTTKQLDQLRQEVNEYRKAIENLYSDKELALQDPKSGNYEEILTKLIKERTRLCSSESKRVALEVEIGTIDHTAGDLSNEDKTHNWKSHSFKIPTACDTCGELIWGLHRQGKHCRDCGYNCHAKCELLTVSPCPGETVPKAERRKGGFLGSLPSGISTMSRTETASSASSLMGSKQNQMNGSSVSVETRGKALYPYTAVADGELDMSEGDDLIVTSPDDGSGWLAVRKGLEEGLVPASYVLVLQARSGSPASTVSGSTNGGGGGGPAKRKGPAVAPRRRGQSKKVSYATALYNYTARSPAELTIHEGDKIMVVAEDTGDGWTEGELNGARGSFPTNYAQF